MSDLVIVAPDAGGVKAAKRFAAQVGADLAFVNKFRPKGVANTVVAANVIGNVAGKRCILFDDMIDTAGTIVAAADLLKEQGATEVWVHGHPRGPVGPGDRAAQELGASRRWC